MKIGEMSKFFDVPMETLRFYEKKGILLPSRQDHNGYREYDLRSWMRLAQTMLLRNMGISLNDISTFLQTGSLLFLNAKIDQRMQEIQSKINYDTYILQWMKRYRDMLDMLPYNVNRYWYTKKPASQYLAYLQRSENTYTPVEDAGVIETSTQWRKNVPFVEICGLTEYEDILNNRNCSTWILYAEKAVTEAIHLKQSPAIRSFPEMRGLTTILDEVTDDGYVEALKPGIEQLRRDGYTLSKPIISTSRLVIYQKGQEHRYHEVFFPID